MICRAARERVENLIALLREAASEMRAAGYRSLSVRLDEEAQRVQLSLYRAIGDDDETRRTAEVPVAEVPRVRVTSTSPASALSVSLSLLPSLDRRLRFRSEESLPRQRNERGPRADGRARDFQTAAAFRDTSDPSSLLRRNEVRDGSESLSLVALRETPEFWLLLVATIMKSVEGAAQLRTHEVYVAIAATVNTVGTIHPHEYQAAAKRAVESPLNLSCGGHDDAHVREFLRQYVVWSGA